MFAWQNNFMGGNSKRWLIKNVGGRIEGPLSTEEVLERIRRGVFSGEEQISLYPNTKWVPIASDPTFYEKLLDLLSQSSPSNLPIEDFSETDPGKKESQQKTSAGQDSKKAERKRDFDDERTVKIELEEDQWSFTKSSPEKTQTKATKATKSKQKKTREAKGQRGDDSVIELVNVEKEVKRRKGKKAIFPALVILLVLIVGVFVVLDGTGGKNGLNLLAPNLKKSINLTEEQTRNSLRRGVKYYLHDNFSEYIKAQNEFVKIIEADKTNTSAMSMLCLTYFEMWPYVAQDSTDIAAITKVNYLASKVDPASIDAATCRVVKLFLEDKLLEAKTVSEGVIDAIGAGGQIPPTAFHYFKALILKENGEYQTALGYITNVEQLWPEWLRPYYVEAEIYLETNKMAEAAKRFRDLLKAKPDHKAARIQYGLLQFRYFRQYQEGKKTLLSALALDTKAETQLESKAYLGLAELYLYEKNTEKAMYYAKKCFYSSGANKSCKNLIESLGGSINMKNFKGKERQLILEGDQLVKEGDCSAAQSIYKTAYEINPKNGVAALKAGRCLWNLSLSTEAIKWLNNAIKADSKLIAAYTQLADYYSQRFDFVAAVRVLEKAAKMSPKNYEVIRGFAKLQLRRSNPQGAILFGKKAIELNSSDVETLVLLAKAQLLIGDHEEAFLNATRAIDIEGTNKAAQIQYSKALAGVQGVDVAVSYLTKLVDQYPQVYDYRQTLGEIYLSDERYIDAANELQQVVQIHENPKKAYLLLADTLSRLNNFDQAEEALIKAAQLDPSDPAAIFKLGLLFMQVKKYSDARAQFRRVISINPNYPMSHLYMGKAALEMNDAKGALEEANKEKKLNPRMADPYILAAEAYTMMRQYSQCAGEYQKAIKISQQEGYVYVKVAKCYRLTGNLNVAEQMLNQAKKLDSGLPEIYKELGSILEKLGKSQQAIEAYQKYLILLPQAPDARLIESRINSL